MSNMSRRQVIGLGAAALAATALPRSARSAFLYGSGGVNNVGRAIIPFTITNNSGSSDPAYLYLFGVLDPLATHPTSVHLSNLNGDCKAFPVSTPNQIYGHQLTGTTTSAFFPQLDAIRAYISFASQLSVSTNEYGIPIAVSADVSSDPNYNTLWDFTEFTWHDYKTHTILDGNVTQVDAFGLAFQIEFNGFDPSNPANPATILLGFNTNTARSKIFKDLTAIGAPWSNLIISSGGSPLRALMPLKSIDLGTFPKDQLDAYLAKIIAFYDSATNNRLVFPYLGVNYTGETTADGFTFTPDKKVANDGTATSTYTIPTPTTRNCYAQDILSTPNDGTGGVICAALGASILRSTLVFTNAGFPVPQSDRSLYYGSQPICEYGKIIHAQGINNHAFCYGYDEVAGDAGAPRQVQNPTSISLTINGL
jgi:hypothetical protein